MKRSPEEVNKALYRYKNNLNEHEGLLTNYVFRKILVFVFILTDFVTLFSLFDAILVENLYMALIFTFSCTLCYNYMPVVMANEINARRTDKEHSLTMLYISSSVFAVIASATAILRLTTREAMFFSPFDGTEDYSGIMNQLSVQPDSPAAYTATIVMAIIPIGTSLVSFWLTLKDDPHSVAIYRNKKTLNRFEQMRISLQSEVERYNDRDIEAELLAWEQLSHDSFVEESFAEIDSVNQYFITLLTTKTKTADSVSFATEDPLGLVLPSENVKHPLLCFKDNPQYSHLDSYYTNPNFRAAFDFRSFAKNAAENHFIGNAFGGTGKFAIGDFVRQKGGRFLFLEYDESCGETLATMIGLLLDLAMMTMMSNETSTGSGYFVLDELHLIECREIEKAAVFMNGQNGCILAATQSHSGLYERYGEHKADSIISSFSSFFFFPCNDSVSRQYVKALCGTTDVETLTTSGYSFRKEISPQNTVNDDALNRLRVGEAIVRIPDGDRYYIAHVNPLTSVWNATPNKIIFSHSNGADAVSELFGNFTKQTICNQRNKSTPFFGLFSTTEEGVSIAPQVTQRILPEEIRTLSENECFIQMETLPYILKTMINLSSSARRS